MKLDFDHDSDGFITYRGVRVGMGMALDEGAMFLRYPEEVRVGGMLAQLRREMLRGRVYGHFC